MIGAADALAGPLLLLAQQGAEPAPDKAVDAIEGAVMGMLEVNDPCDGQDQERGMSMQL